MIELHHLDGTSFVANAELIETIDTSPDTVVSLTSGRKLLVQETPAQVCAKVEAYRRKVRGG